jgi:predicted CopG family antitoxin
VGFENKTNEQGERLIWLDRAAVDRLRVLRGPGESFSDVILRLVETGWRVADA